MAAARKVRIFQPDTTPYDVLHVKTKPYKVERTYPREVIFYYNLWEFMLHTAVPLGRTMGAVLGFCLSLPFRPLDWLIQSIFNYHRRFNFLTRFSQAAGVSVGRGLFYAMGFVLGALGWAISNIATALVYGAVKMQEFCKNAACHLAGYSSFDELDNFTIKSPKAALKGEKGTKLSDIYESLLKKLIPMAYRSALYAHKKKGSVNTFYMEDGTEIPFADRGKKRARKYWLDYLFVSTAGISAGIAFVVGGIFAAIPAFIAKVSKKTDDDETSKAECVRDLVFYTVFIPVLVIATIPALLLMIPIRFFDNLITGVAKRWFGEIKFNGTTGVENPMRGIRSAVLDFIAQGYRLTGTTVGFKNRRSFNKYCVSANLADRVVEISHEGEYQRSAKETLPVMYKPRNQHRSIATCEVFKFPVFTDLKNRSAKGYHQLAEEDDGQSHSPSLRGAKQD